MRNTGIKNLILSALCIAIGIVLPFLTGQIPQIGTMLCPLHFAAFLAAYITNWKYATLTGAITPLLRSAWLGFPAMFPSAVAMAFEMGTYGLVAALLYKVLPKKKISVYISLLSAMVAGRVVWGIVRAIIAGATNSPFTFGAFVSGSILNSIPGIVLQIILIPIIVFSLEKAKLIERG